jgi:transposase-like protein
MKKNNEIDLSKIQNLISEFNINSLADLDSLLNRITKVTVEEMLNQELDNHLGYPKHSNSNDVTTNRRNGKTNKNAKSRNGEVIIEVPRDREGSFEPQVLPKRSNDLSTIEEKILMMYSKGMSQRDIAEMTNEIYGFTASKDMVNRIVDKVLPLVKEWRTRSLNKCYPFIFVDCMFVSIKTDNKRECQVFCVSFIFTFFLVEILF